MSNSKLLEEAIIDAEALREAALKNAEQTILEKYAPEVKSALQVLLEQELPGGPDSMMADESGMTSKPNEELKVSLAATDGEKLCPCPDTDETVTVSLGYLKDKLEQMLMDVTSETNVPPPEEQPMEMAPDMEQQPLEPTEEMPPEEEEVSAQQMMEEIEIDDFLLESLLNEQEGLSDQQKTTLSNFTPEQALRSIVDYWSTRKQEAPDTVQALEILMPKVDAEKVKQELEKDKSSNQRMLDDLKTKLAAQQKKAAKTGMYTDEPSSGDMRNQADIALSVDRTNKKPTGLEESKTHNSKMLVENKKVLNENKLLTEKLTKLLEQHNKILEENKKVKETALQISQRLEETNLMNAILLYKNQALSSDSLNERQKNKIVEAVSKAGSVDEVKMIYETLCNAVGTFESKGPQSLSEAVEKKGGLTFKPRQEKNSNSNPLHSRWQKIAGITK